MKQKRADCRSVVRGKRSVSRPSKCSGRTRNSRRGSRPFPAGRQRSFSMRSTTARVSSYEMLSRRSDCWPDPTPNMKPLKTYYDVALHGSQTAVGFGSNTTNMPARVLAAIIRHSDGWNGQKIRLLACSTGVKTGDEYCFAEELANALGVEVKAPNGVLYIMKTGKMYVGPHAEGAMISFTPNQRGRRK